MMSGTTDHIGASLEAQVGRTNGKYGEAVTQATAGSSVLLVMHDVKQNPEYLYRDTLNRWRMKTTLPTR